MPNLQLLIFLLKPLDFVSLFKFSEFPVHITCKLVLVDFNSVDLDCQLFDRSNILFDKLESQHLFVLLTFLLGGLQLVAEIELASVAELDQTFIKDTVLYHFERCFDISEDSFVLFVEIFVGDCCLEELPCNLGVPLKVNFLIVEIGSDVVAASGEFDTLGSHLGLRLCHRLHLI